MSPRPRPQRKRTASRIRIGTRGSRLALVQARKVRSLLKKFDPSIKIEEAAIKTSGDKSVASGQWLVAGKGLFVKEIEEALIDGRVDIAVHSLKDVPAGLPRGLQLAAFLKREDPSDIFISVKYKNLDDMPAGAVVGTSSPRRAAQVLSVRPDLIITPLRGNVETRIRKVREGMCDATILAAAGLKRLKLYKRLKHSNTQTLKHFISAIGQGVICVESRTSDVALNKFLRAALNHAPTEASAIAERSFLQTVGGDCHTPIAAHAVIKKGVVKITGFVASPNGGKVIVKTASGRDPVKLGEALGRKFVKLGARRIIKAKGIGQRYVLFTCLPGTASDLEEKFLKSGARVIRLPLIKIRPPSDGYEGMDRAIKNIGEYDWIVFTSRNAVAHFVKRLKRLIPPNPPFLGSDPFVATPNKLPISSALAWWGLTPWGMGGLKIAVVGPATAEAVKSHGLNANLMPGNDFSSAGLARKFSKINLKGRRVLFPRAREGKETLMAQLGKQGAKVDLVEAYQTLPAKIDVKKWRERFKKHPPVSVVFASPSAVKTFSKSFGRAFTSKDTQIISIGRTTIEIAITKRTLGRTLLHQEVQ